jgi:hypothetical protein
MCRQRRKKNENPTYNATINHPFFFASYWVKEQQATYFRSYSKGFGQPKYG